jgi:hypothetical protein
VVLKIKEQSVVYTMKLFTSGLSHT